MTIEFDPKTNRATDTESGMAVEFVRDDYPMEVGEFYRLIWQGTNYDFRVGYDDGFNEIWTANPTLSNAELSDLVRQRNRYDYFIPSFWKIKDNILPSNVDLFLTLFSIVCRHHSPTINIVIKYYESTDPVFDSKNMKKLFFKPLREEI